MPYAGAHQAWEGSVGKTTERVEAAIRALATKKLALVTACHLDPAGPGAKPLGSTLCQPDHHDP